MAKQKADTENKVVEHRTGNVKVLTWLNRPKGIFWAEYAGTRYEDKTAEGISRQVYKAIEDSLNVPWSPIIRVQPIKPFGNSGPEDAFVGFTLNRIWVARFPDGQYKAVDQWHGMQTKNMLEWCRSFNWNEEQLGPFEPPIKRGQHSEVYYYYPYTEEHWEWLCSIQKQIRALRTAFTNFFEGLDIEAALLSPALLALPEPTTTKKEEETHVVG